MGVEDKEEKEEGGLMGLLNVVGILVGGALSGYVFVLNQNKEVRKGEGAD